MKCIICEGEHGLNVFNTDAAGDGVLNPDLQYLRGICYYCYQKVPKHIPKKQIKKWLIHERWKTK